MSTLLPKDPKTLTIAGEVVVFPVLPLGKFLKAQQAYWKLLSPLFDQAEIKEGQQDVTINVSAKDVPKLLTSNPETLFEFLSAGTDKDAAFWQEKAMIEDAQKAFVLIGEQNDFSRSLLNSLGQSEEAPAEVPQTATASSPSSISSPAPTAGQPTPS